MAGPVGPGSRLRNSIVVELELAVKVKIRWLHIMSQGHACAASTWKSWDCPAALTRMFMIQGSENGSPEYQNRARYSVPGVVAKVWAMPPGLLPLSATLTVPVTGIQPEISLMPTYSMGLPVTIQPLIAVEPTGNVRRTLVPRLGP